VFACRKISQNDGGRSTIITERRVPAQMTPAVLVYVSQEVSERL
jgi:hypothetical protein